MSKCVDFTAMIGQQYGGVIVEAVVEGPYGRNMRRLSCRCATCGARCGQYTAAALSKRPPLGCPDCSRKLRLSSHDLAGTETDAFIIIERAGAPDGMRTLWRCICKRCGSPCVVEQKYLRVYKSCGCLADEALAKGRCIVTERAAVDGTMLFALSPDRSLNKNSSTGVRGVSYHKGKQKFRAYINLRRKQVSLGLYDTLEEAAAARAAAEEKYYAPILEEHRGAISRDHDGGAEK